MNDDTEQIIADIELAAAITTALRSNAHVPDGVIVDVSHAVITLEGEVDNQDERNAVERLVRGFAGDVAVINKIAFRTPPEFAADHRVSG